MPPCLGVRRAGSAAFPGARSVGSVWGAPGERSQEPSPVVFFRGKAGRVQASGRAGCLPLSEAALAMGHCANEIIVITRRMR
ncbi:hypothetical protein SAMN02787118_11163 [Streptomyces mirabilis]|uniref:Uncharacterized protein n=1 Tax=Streptomyces mirabilis TaxID=68239 RepID=A0A1I2KXZ6_9ACTN|nr:hypothetical protein SAMN02787118_11163 [Streptomyces mirabilis]